MKPVAEPHTAPIRELLATAAQLAVAPPGYAGRAPWYWQAYGEVLELHVDQVHRTDGRRLAAIDCGIALHRAQVVFAALGARGAVHMGGTQEHASATITYAGPHTVTADDTAMLQALSATTITPPSGHLDRDGVVPLLSRAGRPFGVELHEFDETINRFLDANAQPTRRRVPPANADVRQLALITPSDTVDDWLHAGQALSALRLTGAVAGLTVSVDSLAETTGLRTLLRSLAAPAGQPQILIRVA